MSDDTAVASDEQMLRDSLEEWQRMYNQGEFDGISEGYTPDAMFLPPSGPRRGLTEPSTLKDLYDSGQKQAEVELLEIEVSGSMAWLYNETTMYGDDGEVVLVWKVLGVYKKIDGKWLTYRVMFSPI